MTIARRALDLAALHRKRISRLMDPGLGASLPSSLLTDAFCAWIGDLLQDRRRSVPGWRDPGEQLRTSNCSGLPKCWGSRQATHSQRSWSLRPYSCLVEGDCQRRRIGCVRCRRAPRRLGTSRLLCKPRDTFCLLRRTNRSCAALSVLEQELPGARQLKPARQFASCDVPHNLRLEKYITTTYWFTT